MNCASKAIEIAEAELGYLEKRSNSQLDHKTKNAGRGNFTKFARDLYAAGFFNGNKQGYPWCAVFFLWVIWKLCGEDTAKAMEVACQTGPYGASCTSTAQYYKQQGRFHTDNPKPGDQIFFWDAAKTQAAHTGMVTDVDDTYVYTIEGNTSGAVGVVANGGGVFNKRYELDCDRIYGYGSPKYDEEPAANTAPVKKEGIFMVELETLRVGSTGPLVKFLQRFLIGYGGKPAKIIEASGGADGKYYAKTKEAVTAYQSENKDTEGEPLEKDGVWGQKCWGSALGKK